MIPYINFDLTSAQGDLVITGLDIVTAWRENFILWYNDRTHDLVTLKYIYLPNLSGFARIKPFSKPETTWMLILAPAVLTFTSIERNLRSSISSISNGRPLTLPVVGCTLVSPFFFCSCMDFSWLFTHGRTVLLVKFGNFGWNFLIASVTLQIAAYFAISQEILPHTCISRHKHFVFYFSPERLLNFLEPFLGCLR